MLLPFVDGYYRRLEAGVINRWCFAAMHLAQLAQAAEVVTESALALESVAPCYHVRFVVLAEVIDEGNIALNDGGDGMLDGGDNNNEQCEIAPLVEVVDVEYVEAMM